MPSRAFDFDRLVHLLLAGELFDGLDEGVHACLPGGCAVEDRAPLKLRPRADEFRVARI